MCLIAAMDFAALGNLLLVILMVAAGLGTVIFVHELGHFAVAKMCGVKCPKFYIGFDVPLGAMINNMLGREGEFKIFGIGIPRTIGPPITIGETEYGIGILPLGGYVRMLGQDDDPSNINEQLRESQVAGNSPDSKTIVGPDGKSYVVDRRSYLAKSVPQRMAIISAGVIMNVIFAFIFATVAYKIGVPYEPSFVSRTAPGSPAWREAIMPGDEIVQIDDIVKPSFLEELMGSVTLGDLENGLPFVIERDGKQVKLQLVPEKGEKLARVGIASGRSLQVAPPAMLAPHTAAGKATPAFELGDEILAVDGTPVANYRQYVAELLKKSDKPVTLTVLRGATRPADKPEAEPTGGKKVDVVIEPELELTTGLVMQMSKITAVQEDSPAAKAGLKVGDFIERIVAADAGDDAPSLTRDPLLLPAALAELGDAGKEIKLTVRRGAGDESRQGTEELTIPLRKVDWIEEPIAGNDPIPAPALGVAYRALTVVSEAKPGSPAAEAGFLEADELQSAEFIPPADMKDKPPVLKFDLSQGDKKDSYGLPWVLSQLQNLPHGTQLKLTYKRGSEVLDATLTPVPSENFYSVERGIILKSIQRIRIAETWSEAATRGRTETVRSLTMVYRFLSKLGSGQVPVTMLGGPLTIAQAAGYSAFQGWGKLLIFLTMLSANLAVINFLPIPMLDGGHMVFLAWEGLRGRPASERVVMTMQTVGFVFLISLMLFVFTLDLQRMFFA
ncbi:site-2 protease family protein [Lacipirellula sp.]|uniref:site-2 protease family protein n=1 Tax=Lacipirellula sp. TaxID=2691419 RepID=UPI003D0F8E65